MLRTLAILVSLTASPALAGFTFANIDGGEIDLDSYRGKPVLVVNTASRCGFTPQYDGLQALYDKYRDQGFVVLAVPSNDFRQELSTAEEVKDFCEVNFGLDMPMTDITHVKGNDAHPFFAWLRDEHGYTPSWNFNKVLLDGDGQPVATYGSTTRPLSKPLTSAVESLLN